MKAGIKNVCVHKGLFAPSVEKQFPHLRGFCDVADVGKAAKDWPQLNFVIYHSAYRHVGGDPAVALAEFERTGPHLLDVAISPTSRREYGVSNVYGDVGQLFATTLVAQPRVCAALMGTLIKGLGADHVNWGTRRGVDRLAAVADRGPAPARDPRGHAEEARLRAARRRADGPVKTAIFGGNNARLYSIQPKRAMLELKNDRITAWKDEYEKEGPTPTNMRYGYVAGPVDHSLFA